MDRLSPEARSENMRRVKGKDTAPEHIVRRTLHAMGVRFRLHRRDLPGCPDIVLPSRKIVVFVHGCFCHRHGGCRRTTMPAVRTDFWEAKFARTVKRDAEATLALERLGWRVVVIWECELRDADLARRVCRHEPAAEERRHRCGVHDRPARCGQLRPRKRARAHRAGEIDREHGVERGNVVLRTAANDARAIDEEVQTFEIADRP